MELIIQKSAFKDHQAFFYLIGNNCLIGEES